MKMNKYYKSPPECWGRGTLKTAEGQTDKKSNVSFLRRHHLLSMVVTYFTISASPLI